MEHLQKQVQQAARPTDICPVRPVRPPQALQCTQHFQVVITTTSTPTYQHPVPLNQRSHSRYGLHTPTNTPTARNVPAWQQPAAIAVCSTSTIRHLSAPTGRPPNVVVTDAHPTHRRDLAMPTLIIRLDCQNVKTAEKYTLSQDGSPPQQHLTIFIPTSGTS